MFIFVLLFVVFFTPSFLFSERENINLEKAVEVGLLNSYLFSKRSMIKSLEDASINEKIREYFPRVGVSYYAIKNINENQADTLYKDMRLNLQQMVYDGGETSRQLDIVRLGTKLSEYDILHEIKELELKIKKVYFKCLESRGKVTLSKIYFRNINQVTKDIQLEWEAGFKSKLHVMEAKSYLKQAEYILSKNLEEYKLNLLELKNLLGIDKNLEIVLEENLLLDYSIYSPDISIEEISNSIYDIPIIKKAKYSIEKSKKQKEGVEESYYPKFFIGGYYGKNSNDSEPLKHEAYGINFNIVVPLGSSQLSSNGNYGIQSDGTGIQRISGFGPQYVGKGENSYNNAQLQLFDNFSTSRKILEGEILFYDSVENLKKTEKEYLFKLYKSFSGLKDSYQSIQFQNTKLQYKLETLKANIEKYKQGLIKFSELGNSEYEYLNSAIDLSSSISTFINNYFELCFYSGNNKDVSELVKYNKNKGNSLFYKILINEPEIQNLTNQKRGINEKK